MKVRLLVYVLIVPLLSMFALLQEVKAEDVSYDIGDVIVSASRVEESLAGIGSSAVVITSKEIEQKKYKSVLEAVQTKMGISTTSNSVFGGATSIFLRGSESGHTLVMLDGIRLYDPISTNATYDLANMTLDNVERIEIIKGPQSSLYGSDAIGGVINIITKKGEGKPRFFTTAEIASKETYSESIGVSGSVNKFNYSLEASRKDSDGISKARDGRESDEYDNTSVNSKFSYELTDDLELGFQESLIRANYHIDDGVYQEDPNKHSKYENFITAVFADHEINDIWGHHFKYSWLRNTRQNFDDDDELDSGEFERILFKGWLHEIDWQHNVDIAKLLPFIDGSIKDMVVAGFQFTHEAGRQKYVSGSWASDLSRISSHDKGFYIENKFDLDDRLFNTVAVRVDDHSRFGEHTTGRTTLAYLFDWGTKLKGSYGTGFNAPSLYQLFSDLGDANLKAEKSWGYDCGFEQDLLNGKVSLSTVYFHNRFEDLIDVDWLRTNPKTGFPGVYVNIGSARTEGIEAEIRLNLIDNLMFGYGFTYTEADDLTNNYNLARRPHNKHNININYKFLEKFNVNFNLIRNVKIYEIFVYGQTPQRLKDYTKCDLAVSYDINDDLDCYLRVENLFDETYQEANGYSVKPQFFHLGVKARF